MKNNNGFTIPEVIMVAAVMAILTTVTFSSLTTFVDQQRKKEEAVQLAEIKKAIEVYAKSMGELPLDDADRTPSDPLWYDELARFSNLSAQDMQFDTWNRERIYKMYEDASGTFRDAGQLNIYYATVFSAGPNNAVETNTTRVARDSGTSAVELSGVEWWDESATPIEWYGDMRVDGDDQVIKFTDLKIKTDNYFLNQERLKAIAEALEVYAQGKQNEALITNDADLAAGRAETYPNINQLQFYPPALATSAPDLAAYMNLVRLDADIYNLSGTGSTGSYSATNPIPPNQDRVLNTASHDARRVSMINLMRLLGLPDSYCCNALDHYETSASGSTVRQELPFYYFSNPRPRVPSGSNIVCGARPNGSGSNGFLPPRLSVDHNSSNTGTFTNPPTCG